MATKKITPKNPQAKDDAADDAGKSAERKTAAAKWNGRKVGRKAAVYRVGGN